MRFWRRYHNKVLAIGFASLALIAYLASFLVYGFSFGWGFLTASPFTLISALITLVVYAMVLSTNIQNDNRAYNAILMFVFLVVWGLVWAFLPVGINVFSFFPVGGYVSGLATIVALSDIAAAILGVFFYVFVYRYRLGRCRYPKVEALGWWFAGVVVLGAVASIALVLSVTSLSPVNIAYTILYYAPDALMAVAVVFTLKRLRY